jgi:hypothetical protein
LRQEQLAVQLIREFQSIWAEEKVACFVKQSVLVFTLRDWRKLTSWGKLPDIDHRE